VLFHFLAAREALPAFVAIVSGFVVASLDVLFDVPDSFELELQAVHVTKRVVPEERARPGGRADVAVVYHLAVLIQAPSGSYPLWRLEVRSICGFSFQALQWRGLHFASRCVFVALSLLVILAAFC
jgi:hypothetical protein